MCTRDRVMFIVSTSNHRDQELQQCLEADLDFPVGDFIVQRPFAAPMLRYIAHEPALCSTVGTTSPVWRAQGLQWVHPALCVRRA